MRLRDTFPADLVVLVAEDDAFTRSLLRKMLHAIGVATVLTADDGDEALEIFRSGTVTIDVVLSDIHMPKRNGFELLDEIRKVDDEVPFLFVTGDTREQAVVAARSRDVAAYLVKPLSPAQLCEKIAAVLLRAPGYAHRNWTRTVEGQAFQSEASERMCAAYEVWNVGTANGSMPPVAMLRRWDIDRTAPFDRTAFAVHVLPPGPRLRYAFVGAEIQAKLGRNPAGEHVDEQSFLHRHHAMPAYARVLATRGPHYRFVNGIEAFYLVRYRRLLLPFGDETGVQTILGCVDLL